MKINLEFKVLPFQVPMSVSLVSNKSVEVVGYSSVPAPPAYKPPKGVSSDEGGVVLNHIKLSSLSANALEELCEEFTNAVFKEAGRGRPARPSLPFHVKDASGYNTLVEHLLKVRESVIRATFINDEEKHVTVHLLNKWIDDK